MKKQIRLTESALHNIILESIHNYMLKEAEAIDHEEMELKENCFKVDTSDLTMANCLSEKDYQEIFDIQSETEFDEPPTITYELSFEYVEGSTSTDRDVPDYPGFYQVEEATPNFDGVMNCSWLPDKYKKIIIDAAKKYENTSSFERKCDDAVFNCFYKGRLWNSITDI
jgi:hypothetical protein